MISKKQFNVLNQERWQGLDRIASGLQSKESLPKKELRELPALFRKVCKDRAIAEEANVWFEFNWEAQCTRNVFVSCCVSTPENVEPIAIYGEDVSRCDSS